MTRISTDPSFDHVAEQSRALDDVVRVVALADGTERVGDAPDRDVARKRVELDRGGRALTRLDWPGDHDFPQDFAAAARIAGVDPHQDLGRRGRAVVVYGHLYPRHGAAAGAVDHEPQVGELFALLDRSGDRVVVFIALALGIGAIDHRADFVRQL